MTPTRQNAPHNCFWLESLVIARAPRPVARRHVRLMFIDMHFFETKHPGDSADTCQQPIDTAVFRGVQRRHYRSKCVVGVSQQLGAWGGGAPVRHEKEGNAAETGPSPPSRLCRNVRAHLSKPSADTPHVTRHDDTLLPFYRADQSLTSGVSLRQPQTVWRTCWHMVKNSSKLLT